MPQLISSSDKGLDNILNRLTLDDALNYLNVVALVQAKEIANTIAALTHKLKELQSHLRVSHKP